MSWVGHIHFWEVKDQRFMIKCYGNRIQSVMFSDFSSDYTVFKFTQHCSKINDKFPVPHWEFCPKIPFKLTQSIHVALQKSCNFDWKLLKDLFLTLKPIKGKLDFLLEIMKKIARWRHKSEISKRNVKTMISPLLFRL